MQRNVAMKRLLATGMILSAGGPPTAFAQTASQITSPTLAPPARLGPGRVDIPPGGGPAAPAGAEALEVTLGDPTIEGAAVDAPALAQLRASLLGRRIRVSDIYAAASVLDAHYARVGRVLVRVTVPPQQLDDGATLRLVVTLGFIERVDASAVPPRVRSPVQRLWVTQAVTVGAPCSDGRDHV